MTQRVSNSSFFLYMRGEGKASQINGIRCPGPFRSRSRGFKLSLSLDEANCGNTEEYKIRSQRRIPAVVGFQGLVLHNLERRDILICICFFLFSCVGRKLLNTVEQNTFEVFTSSFFLLLAGEVMRMSRTIGASALPPPCLVDPYCCIS